MSEFLHYEKTEFISSRLSIQDLLTLTEITSYKQSANFQCSFDIENIENIILSFPINFLLIIQTCMKIANIHFMYNFTNSV